MLCLFIYILCFCIDIEGLFFIFFKKSGGFRVPKMPDKYDSEKRMNRTVNQGVNFLFSGGIFSIFIGPNIKWVLGG